MKSINNNRNSETKPKEIFNLRRIIKIFLFIVAASAIAILIVYKISDLINKKSLALQYEPRHFVNLNPASEIDVEKDDGVNVSFCRMAVAPTISPEKSLLLYKPFADYISKALGKQGELMLPVSYLETNNLLRYGRCDIAFGCTYHFILGARDFGLEMPAVPVINGSQEYYSFIITPTSSPAKTLLDLKNKRFASEDILSTTGWLYPAIWLHDHGKNPYDFFSEHLITGSMDNTILAVASGYIDGAAVGSIAYLNMPDDITSKIKIIQKSPPFGSPPVVINPKIDAKTKKQLLKLFLEMHLDKDGLKILSAIGIDQFVEPDESRYNTIREYSKILEAIQ